MALIQKLIDWWPNFTPPQTGKRYYEAVNPSNYRPRRGSQASGDALMQQAGTRLRNQSRYLEENHDLMVAVLDDLVNNVIGTGAAIQPMVKLKSGQLATETNRELSEAFEEWSEYPEASNELGWESTQRLSARYMFRDGELFFQMIGKQSYRYLTPVPFVLQLIEPDYIPFWLTDESRNITHGIERNSYGAPIAFHVLEEHPGESLYFPADIIGKTRRVSVQRMRQIKNSRRLNQARGVPIGHSIIERLRDTKDYEESERIAAKIASNQAAAITKDLGVAGANVDSQTHDRVLEMQAGTIFELNPGESIENIGQNRPNEKLIDFRNAMLRAVAGGSGTRFSSIARDYSGTYSSQRQELVEGAVGYRGHFAYLRSKYYKPIWRRFVEQAVFSGAVRVQPGVDMRTITRAEFRPPALPWIDPQKEAAAWKILREITVESASEIMRQRGRDPQRVKDEIEEEKASGVFDAIKPQPAPAPDQESDDQVPEDDDQREAARA